MFVYVMTHTTREFVSCASLFSCFPCRKPEAFIIVVQCRATLSAALSLYACPNARFPSSSTHPHSPPPPGRNEKYHQCRRVKGRVSTFSFIIKQLKQHRRPHYATINAKETHASRTTSNGIQSIILSLSLSGEKSLIQNFVKLHRMKMHKMCFLTGIST